MILTNITAKNFLSFKELSYDFESHPVLIQGENLTEDSQESNGSGKSAIQAAIEYALFRSTSKKVTDSELIFFGEKEAEVSLSIDCEIRGETLAISRSLKLKGSSGVEVFIIRDGIENKVSLATVNDADNFIIEWVGISKEDLQNYFIINKERYKSFFSSSNKEKIDMINRFSNAKLIDGVDKSVKGDIEVIQKGLRDAEYKKVESLARVKLMKQQIQDELNRDLEGETNTEIAGINSKIDSLVSQIEAANGVINVRRGLIIRDNNLIKEKKEKVNDLKISLDKFESTVQGINSDIEEIYRKYEIEDNRIKGFEELRKSEERKLYDLRDQHNQLIDIIEDINKVLAGTVECPKCHHKFNYSDSSIDLQEEQITKENTVSVLKIVDDQMSNCQTSIANIGQEIKGVVQFKKHIFEEEILLKQSVKDSQGKLKELIEAIQTLNSEVVTLEKAAIPTHEQLILQNQNLIESNLKKIEDLKESQKSITKELDYIRINSLKEKMRGEGFVIRAANDLIRKLKKDEFEASQWLFNFKKFNMYLANQSLKVIQGYCNKFLNDIKTDLQVKWEGIKILSNGDLREEITPYIIRNSNLYKFWSFSGGERARMEYAVIFTMQEMINRTNKYGGLNFLSTDEIAEGLDALGLSDLMKSLNNLNKTVLITTHVVNRNIGNNILLVRKENGVSKIVN